MSGKVDIFNVQDWRVFGRNVFKPPFKVSDALINEARIVYVVKGNARLYSANQYYDLTDDDLLIMKSDNFINNWLANENEELNYLIVFQLRSDFLNFLYEDQLPTWFKKTQEQPPASVHKISGNTMIAAFIQNLKTYLDNPMHLTEEVIKIKMKELISLLVQVDGSGSVKAMLSHLFTSTDYSFKEVVQNNLFEDLNLDDLAFLTGMSLSSFKRKFTATYGTSPNKFIIGKRLEKGRNLLKTTQMSVAEIAYDCGFSDEGYFSKTFKKHFQLSPSQFRA